MGGTGAVIDVVIVALAFGSTLVGGYVGYQAYRGYRRHDSRAMQALSLGLLLLTTVAFGIAFGGSLLLRQGYLTLRYQPALTLVTRGFQFVGVILIAYSLHSRA
jgi:cytochrome bd-type quinol oxidase subunit 1